MTITEVKIKSNKGFTTIDLMLVIAIVYILATITLPTIKKAVDVDKSHKAKAKIEHVVKNTNTHNKKKSGRIFFILSGILLGGMAGRGIYSIIQSYAEDKKHILRRQQRYIDNLKYSSNSRYGNVRPRPTFYEDNATYEKKPYNNSFGEVILTYLENICQAIWDAITFKDKKQNNSELDKNSSDTQGTDPK